MLDEIQGLCFDENVRVFKEKVEQMRTIDQTQEKGHQIVHSTVAHLTHDNNVDHGDESQIKRSETSNICKPKVAH